MTILGCILLVTAATGLHQLSTIPKIEPDISEFVWCDSYISDHIMDMENKIKTVTSLPFNLDAALEALQDMKKNLKSDHIMDKENKIKTVTSLPFNLDAALKALQDKKKNLKMAMRLR